MNPISKKMHTQRFPLLLVPGFPSHRDSYQEFMSEIASRGYTVLYPEYEQVNRKTKNPLRVVSINKQKELAIINAIKKVGVMGDGAIPRVDVIAHSKGAIDVLTVAYNHPEYFHTIYLVAPAGFHPHTNIISSLKKALSGKKLDKQDKIRLARTGGEAVAMRIHASTSRSARYKKEDRFAYFLEGLTASHVTVLHFLPRIRKAGVRVALIIMTNDSQFPTDSYIPYKGLVDSFVEIPGIHGEITYKPREVALELVKLLQN